MNEVEGSREDQCAIYVDLGTTNTRVFAMRGSEVVARASRSAGARDTAREGSSDQIRAALRELIDDVRAQAERASAPFIPTCVAAAGMISSAQGLAELPHVTTPAGVEELAACSRWFQFPDVTDLPVLLIPGVLSESTKGGIASLQDLDVMRGEETLCVGLIELGLTAPPSVVLNLGSHWKAIEIDDQKRIRRSRTSLSGELIHAAQTQTILTSSISSERPTELAQEWVDAGIDAQQRSGLPRALFCVRLLEIEGDSTPEDRLAFLIGAFIGEDRDGLADSGFLSSDREVAIAGKPALADAWRSVLARMSVSANVLAPADVERAFMAGLGSVLSASKPR
jgi:2-dehydro-3-deoxygalactonokinase